MSGATTVRVEALLAEAERLAAGGRADLARAKLAEVLRLNPDEPRALNTLALHALNAEREPAKARELLARAAAAAPGVPAIRLNLADACRALGDGAGERAAVEAALAIDPYFVPALVRRARLLEAAGEEGAARAWGAVLAVMPPAPPAAMAATLAHARAFVEAEAERTHAAIAAPLAAAREGPTPRIDHAVDHLLGRRRIFVNQPTGLHVPRLPADEYFDRAHFPWMDALEAASGAIIAEGRALLAHGGGFSPYVAYPPGTPVNQWEKLNHSADWGAQFLWRDGRPNAALMARCPETVRALEAIARLDIPGRGPTAFWSLLKAGAHIPPHTGVTNARAIVHLGISVPPGCAFRVGSETREWRDGACFAFDDTIEHEAWNRGGKERLVLIFDVWNPWLDAAERARLRALFAALDAHRGGGRFE